MRLTNDDKETFLFPTLTTKERFELQANLVNFGHPINAMDLSTTELETIRQLWPSQVTFSHDKTKDFFRRNSTHEYDRFELIKSESARRINKPVLNQNADLLNLLNLKLSTESPRKDKTTSAPTATPKEMLASLLTEANSSRHPQTENDNKIQTTQLQRTTNSPLCEESATQIGKQKAVRFADGKVMRSVTPKDMLTCQDGQFAITFVHTIPSVCPVRTNPTDVVNVCLKASSGLMKDSFFHVFRRFKQYRDGSLGLFITKEKTFQELTRIIPTSVQLNVEVKVQGKTESGEIMRRTAYRWFAPPTD